MTDEATTGQMLLEGVGLSKRYGGLVALDDVAIRVRAGEILGLVGPNGAGKTTLVDLVTGAQAADGGRLSLTGRPLKGSAARRAKLGLARTFQHPLLAPETTVLDAVASGLVARRMSNALTVTWQLLAACVRSPGADLEHAADLCAEFGVGGLGRACGELTLGEQRLVEVVRAIAQEPQVLLLDEPFAGADHAGVSGTIEAVRAVQERGHGVILVDHNVDLIAGLADRTMLLDQGRVRFDGTPQDCMASPEMREVYFGGVLHD